MDCHIQILKSKLFIPRVSEIVKRHRLHSVFAEIPKSSVISVIAGAGYGKSTLMAEAVHYLGLQTVWYRLDRTDRDFMTILSYLIEGIRQHYGDFGKTTNLRLMHADSSNLGREAVLKSFLAELEATVSEDFIIVLDDFHLVQNTSEIKETVEFLIEHTPPSVHLIIISRSDLELRIFRHRSAKEILQIGEDDLSFSISETEQLFSQLFLIPLTNKNLQALHQKTAGWISGLILFFNSIKGKGQERITGLLLNLKGSQKVLSRYLEDNIYENLMENIKDFLKKTSLLSRLEPDFCDALLGINESRQIITQLEEKHLFTFSVDEERKCFSYHHLFQDFLLSKLDTDFSRTSILELHKTIARIWENQGEKEEALRHCLQAEAYPEACLLLRMIGKNAIAKGQIQLILSWIEGIPTNYLEQEPWVLYTYGRALELSGKRQQAVDVFKQALHAFVLQNQSTGAEHCLYALGNSYYITGDFSQADQILSKLLKQTTQNPGLTVSVLGSLLFITSHQGNLDRADRFFKKALSLVPQLENREAAAWLYFNQGFRHCFAGNFNTAMEYGEQVDDICQQHNLYYARAFNCHLRSWTSYYLGEFSEGTAFAEQGIGLVKKEGYGDTSYAWLATDYALNAIGNGNISDAIVHVKSAIRIFQDQGTIWGESWAYHILYDAYKADGRAEEAEEYVRSGIELLKQMHLPLQEGMLKKRLAELFFEKQQWQAASDLLHECEIAFKNKFLQLAETCFLMAKLLWTRHEQRSAEKKLLQGLSISEANHYDIWVVAEKSWIMPLLVRIYANGDMCSYIQKIVKLIGAQGLPELLQFQKDNHSGIQAAASRLIKELKSVPPPGLKVHCMGEFRLFRANREIGQKQWKSKKALLLFKYLLHKRSYGYIHKDVLMELVWPDVTPRKSSGRLHDALSALRQILEPEKKGTAGSSYLLREGNSYKLTLGDIGSVDTEEFMDGIRQLERIENSKDSIKQCLKVESLYRGDFLVEDRFEDWCDVEREKLKGAYLSLLEKIMAQFESGQNHQKCIEYAHKYLAKDKTAEPVYRKLMRFYAHTGNKPMVSKTYDNCRKNLFNGLDASVSSETESLYQALLSH